MKYKLFVTDEAESEIQTEYDWYEEKGVGLGDRLLASIDEAFEIITNFPGGFPVRRKNYHECSIADFPYLIIYRVVKDTVIVHQLFHVKRRPGKKVK